MAATAEQREPKLPMNNGTVIPQLGFGCYKVPASASGVEIFRDAVRSGYRHFDTASLYGNEAALGDALRGSGIPRGEFYLVSKVWNDAQKSGRQGVRRSVERSLEGLNFGGYFDLYLIHWPVPDCYVDTYLELQSLQRDGKLRSLGLSNFSPGEYENLMKDDGITIEPVVNQFEVSPFMYRPRDILYFQSAGVVVAASKAMNRGADGLKNYRLQRLAFKYGVTAAQIMIRWGIQKDLVVLTKTSNADRMQENRDVLHFSICEEDMQTLDALTDAEAVQARSALEEERKKSM